MLFADDLSFTNIVQMVTQAGAMGLLAILVWQAPSWFKLIMEARKVDQERWDKVRAEDRQDRKDLAMTFMQSQQTTTESFTSALSDMHEQRRQETDRITTAITDQTKILSSSLSDRIDKACRSK